MTHPAAGRRLGRRALTVAGFVLVLAGIPAASSAQDAAPTSAPAFVGYRSTATGTALSAFPTLPALLPVAVPFEATLSLAAVTLSSGGQGFGRASSFFPGTLTAGLRPLLQTGAGVQLPLPDYPLVVESREFEPAKHADIPGLTMTSDVQPARATAVADVGALAIPAVVGVRSLHTESTTTLTATTITATSTTTLHGIDVGAVSIGTLVSVASVTSDGTHSTCSGGLTISGVTVAGTPATLDDGGLHVSGRSTTPGLGVGPLVSTVLANSGVTARALNGIDACTKANGSRTTTGVLFTVPLPAIGAIPAGGGLSLVLGSTAASAGASTLAAPAELGGTTSPALGAGDIVPLGGAFGNGGLSLPPSAAVVPPGRGTGSTGLATQDVSSFAYDGVPMSLLVGLALLALVASTRVRRYMERIIGVVGG